MVTNTDHKTIDARSCSFVYMANAITSPMVQDFHLRGTWNKPGPSGSTIAGILPFGLTARNSGLNCSPFIMFTVCASYSSSISSRAILTCTNQRHDPSSNHVMSMFEKPLTIEPLLQNDTNHATTSANVRGTLYDSHLTSLDHPQIGKKHRECICSN